MNNLFKEDKQVLPSVFFYTCIQLHVSVDILELVHPVVFYCHGNSLNDDELMELTAMVRY